MSLNNNKFDALGSHSEDEEEETFIEDKTSPVINSEKKVKNWRLND